VNVSDGRRESEYDDWWINANKESWVRIKKTDYDEDDDMNQEVDSNDEVMHVEISDQWFSHGSLFVMEPVHGCFLYLCRPSNNCII